MLKEMLKRYHRSLQPTNGRAAVYFMQAAEKPTAPVKIGVSGTRSLNRRLATVQTGYPDRLGILGVLPAPSRQAAFAMEKALHDLLAPTRRSGEWFDPSATLWDILRNLKRY